MSCGNYIPLIGERRSARRCDSERGRTASGDSLTHRLNDDGGRHVASGDGEGSVGTGQSAARISDSGVILRSIVGKIYGRGSVIRRSRAGDGNTRRVSRWDLIPLIRERANTLAGHGESSDLCRMQGTARRIRSDGGSHGDGGDSGSDTTDAIGDGDGIIPNIGGRRRSHGIGRTGGARDCGRRVLSPPVCRLRS